VSVYKDREAVSWDRPQPTDASWVLGRRRLSRIAVALISLLWEKALSSRLTHNATQRKCAAQRRLSIYSACSQDGQDDARPANWRRRVKRDLMPRKVFFLFGQLMKSQTSDQLLRGAWR
jgi:hypothetical protein